MVKPPPIKAILWSPVKSEKSQKLTKMSFLTFYQYLGLFSMDGRHVPLWERDSACGRGILPVEEVFCLWKRYSACGREILPVEERFCLWKRCIAMGERFSLWRRCIPVGERFSLWRRCIPLGETYPYGWALFPEKNENENPKNEMNFEKI